MKNTHTCEINFIVIKDSKKLILWQVGDAGPILDVMAVMLESISSIPVMARNTIATVFRVAQIVAFLPHQLYQNKVRLFPFWAYGSLLYWIGTFTPRSCLYVYFIGIGFP